MNHNDKCINSEEFLAFKSQLYDHGLNLCCYFNLNSLPEDITSYLPENNVHSMNSLILVGNKGGKFYDYLKQTNQDHGDCFDEISLKLTFKLLNSVFPSEQYLQLYPKTNCLIPLQQLGHLAGWGRPSVLGLDIHPEYGTWFAYRVALMTSISVADIEYKKVDEVCEQCQAKPCIKACPVDAVSSDNSLQLNACLNYKIKDNSRCTYHCDSRLQCPVGRDFIYSKEQLHHHGKYTLAALRKYKFNRKG